MEVELLGDPESFDEPEYGPVMTDEEFDEGLAAAARGEGELFESASIGDFKHG